MTKNVIIGVCATCWTFAYILSIHRAQKDKTYGFPVLAVLLNLNWELVYGVFYPNSSPVGRWVPLVWLAIDLLILAQIVNFHNAQRTVNVLGYELGQRLLIVIGFCCAFFMIMLGHHFDIWIINSAFGQNLLMSILFVAMLRSQNTSAGQSIYIGILRTIGTGVVVLPLLAFSKDDTWTMAQEMVFGGILFFDLMYIILLYRSLVREGISPMTRL